jgi:Fe-S-cluster-containing dehydrogenase component/DMSO reductase anchor subunit
MTLEADPNPRTLIDELLAEQQRLTAVERFSQRHEGGNVPAQERYYRDLIPLSRPTPGQQYGFSVDLDACTGCKACVSACHSLNGLEEDELWRSVGLIHSGGEEIAYQQTVTTACHHCVEPGCLEGCPVMAYEKDADTGIVRHLDDQCIGCQYCVLKCPYDVPKYSKRLGIVRKCDMCTGRLSAGEAPACVQACPHEAITITLVDRAEVSRLAAPGTAMLPGAFDSSYTKPTTRFTSKRPLPSDARSADAQEPRLDHPHWPLIVMLLFTQGAAGLFVAAMMLRGDEARNVLSAGCLMLHAGLGASVFHLGRPLGAWRFFLGLATSWMSREILVFGLFAGAATLAALTAWVPPLRDFAPLLTIAAAVLGVGGVFTSAMIYIDTRREFWGKVLTFPKFYGSVLLVGFTAAAALLRGPSGFAFATAAIVIRTALFLWEIHIADQAARDASHAAHGSILAIRKFLPWVPLARSAFFAAATVAALTGMFTAHAAGAMLALGFTLASQLMERFCFFATCPAPRMPGGVPS